MAKVLGYRLFFRVYTTHGISVTGDHMIAEAVRYRCH
jgi:hypothetical protein